MLMNEDFGVNHQRYRNEALTINLHESAMGLNYQPPTGHSFPQVGFRLKFFFHTKAFATKTKCGHRFDQQAELENSQTELTRGSFEAFGLGLQNEKASSTDTEDNYLFIRTPITIWKI